MDDSPPLSPPSLLPASSSAPFFSSRLPPRLSPPPPFPSPLSLAWYIRALHPSPPLSHTHSVFAGKGDSPGETRDLHCLPACEGSVFLSGISIKEVQLSFDIIIALNGKRKCAALNARVIVFWWRFPGVNCKSLTLLSSWSTQITFYFACLCLYLHLFMSVHPPVYEVMTVSYSFWSWRIILNISQ